MRTPDYDSLAAPPDPDVETIEAELAAHLNGADTGYVIETPGVANWCLHQLSEIAELRRTYVDELDLWAASIERLDKMAGWLETRLRGWGIESRTRTHKSFMLPAGRVATRDVKPGLEIVDHASVVDWAAAQHPELVHTTVTKQVLVSELVDAVKIADLPARVVRRNTETGEVFELTDAQDDVPNWSDKELAAFVAHAKDGFMDPWTVVIETEPVVLDAATGAPVPGVRVRPGRISATVTATPL
jgi:hypothetical protein